jgi:hypothetical protein
MRSRSVSTNIRSTILQGQAALVALVFVASQLGSYLHAATEHHARCPEHGELIHVDAAGGDVVEIGDAADATEGAALRSAATGDHEHDHCYLCPVSRERPGTLSHAGAIAAVTPAVIEHALPAAAAHVGQPRYLIAPKTSPPL